MLRVLFAGAVAIFAHMAAAQAQDRWVTLGSGELESGFKGLSLDTSAVGGHFEAIRLRTDSTASIAVRLTTSRDCRVDVLFTDRPDQKLDLPGWPDFIDRVKLLGPSDFKARIVVEGLQGPSAALAKRTDFRAIPGAQTTSWGIFDIDATADRRSLYSCDERNVFDEIELHVLDGDVLVRGLKITYHREQAQTELVALNTELKRNSRTKRLRLKGTFPIASIELWYELNFKDRARVELHKYQSNDLVNNVPGACPFRMEWNQQKRECSPVLLGKESRMYFASMKSPSASMKFPSKDGVSLSRPDCVGSNMCTPIAIFFGTNRKRDDKDGRVGFGPDRVPAMSLGQAIVTVPKPHGIIGEIKRPGYWSWKDWRDWLIGAKEDPRRHFSIPKKGIQVFETPEQFIAAVLAASKELPAFKDHAFVYVHGFTVQFDDALYRLAQLSYDLGEDRDGRRIPFGLPFLFSWPTVGGVFDYATDTESARRSEAHLREFLELVVTKSQAKNVHLIAHSMGNQPLLQVMKQIASAAHPSIKFNQVILAAPDVDKDEFIELAKLINPIAKNITLYASSRDEAMIASRTAHSGKPRAGDVPTDGPVVLKEVHTIDATELNTQVFWTPGHSKYAEDTLLLEDIGKIVREGLMPPHDRTLSLGRRQVRDFWYWFFPRPKSPFG